MKRYCDNKEHSFRVALIRDICPICHKQVKNEVLVPPEQRKDLQFKQLADWVCREICKCFNSVIIDIHVN